LSKILLRKATGYASRDKFPLYQVVENSDYKITYKIIDLKNFSRGKDRNFLKIGC